MNLSKLPEHCVSILHKLCTTDDFYVDPEVGCFDGYVDLTEEEKEVLRFIRDMAVG